MNWRPETQSGLKIFFFFVKFLEIHRIASFWLLRRQRYEFEATNLGLKIRFWSNFEFLEIDRIADFCLP